MLSRWPRAWASERGATAVEYALILALVVGTIAVAVIILGQAVAALYNTPLPGL